jgi:hypothetical protein
MKKIIFAAVILLCLEAARALPVFSLDKVLLNDKTQTVIGNTFENEGINGQAAN